VCVGFVVVWLRWQTPGSDRRPRSARRTRRDARPPAAPSGSTQRRARWREATLPARSIYRLLATQRERLFPPGLFADLFQPTGRRSVPPSILAVVMVLQRLEGLSDREAADRFAFDVRWRYAAGVPDPVPGQETGSFAHTVLVDLRSRLRASADPDRIFRVTTDLARSAGLVGVRRVLDSAPLEDAVATQDTVTMIRGAIRGLLRACAPPLVRTVREALARDDDYATAGKPACDWDDPVARAALVDALVRDGYRALHALRGQVLDERVGQAAELLATVVGQDIEETDDGRFVLAQGVAADRVISVVDPEARHGHKTAARRFDATRGTWPSTLTARSSPPPRPARLRPRMPRSPRRCLPTCPPATPKTGTRAGARTGTRAKTGPGRASPRSTATAPTAPPPTWSRSTSAGSGRWSPPKSRPRPAGGWAKTASPSTWPPARSPAPPS
jgi:Transposase domain (DUF772)